METGTRRTITQRELRNDSAAVMDAVEAGETLVVTRNGNPVAELKPIGRGRFTPVDEVLAAFAAIPAPDYASLRADIDDSFGEDRIGDA